MEKDKFITLPRKTFSENKYVNVGAFNFEIVKDCKCLGQIVTNKNKLRRDLEKNCEYKQSILYCIVLYCIVHFFLY